MLRSPFLTSLLDNDFYKFTMQNAVVKLFPYACARYEFINRGGHAFPKGFSEMLRTILDTMVQLKLTTEEQHYLEEHCPYLDPTYLDFLRGYRYDPAEVKIVQKGEDLKVFIEGLWYRTILWEVPLMAVISELYYRLTDAQRLSDAEVVAITQEKIYRYKAMKVPIAEFGTRRRYSYEVHQLVLKTLKEEGKDCFIGSSNIHLAHYFDVKPIGTHAHEWFMFHGAKYGFKMANRLALEHWTEVYRGDLGIALSDTYTTLVFFESFDKKFAKLFDGIRHDSGDPIAFAQVAIQHYQCFKIDPLSKTIIFSDSLNPDKVARIAAFCRGKIGMSFGIGTNFTNDVGLPVMNIVVKMVEALPEREQWTPVVKLSDVPEKCSGDPAMVKLAEKFLHIR
ncbi:MAG: nicotinate phosphoribosyltransferase [Flavobacteriales bacterium AspAUS03]